MNPVPGTRLLAWIARLVPEGRRAEWEREWQAEGAFAWRRARQQGRASWVAGLRLRVRAMSAVIDALWVRRESLSMTGFSNDLRYAFRALMRRPGFAGVTVLTLALGIGATTAVFTLVNGVLLKALPFDRPDELIALQHLGRDGRDELPMSPGLYLLYRDQTQTLSEVALFARTAVTLMTDGQPERVFGQSVTPSFLTALGTGTSAGRGFLPEEGLPGAAPVVILSDGLWRSHFGGDPTVVGRTMDMSGTSRQVVGIMPAGFGYPDREAAFWLPMAIDETQAPFGAFFASGIARLAPGATLETAQGEVAGLLSGLPNLLPDDPEAAFLAEVNLRASLNPLKETLIGNVRTTLWVLLGTVGFVLVIACANVANLLLVRAESRQRELTVRVAVGAGRRNVLSAFMGESLLLAGAGGALGLMLAMVAIRLTTALLASGDAHAVALPRLDEVVLDGRVLAFAAVLILGCVMFFGIFPMVRYGTPDLASALRGGGARGTTGGRERHRLRSGLVVTQVALALVLLVGSGLMLRSFRALRAVDPGFDPSGTLTARIVVPSAEMEGWSETAGFFRQLRDRLAEQPGVAAVGMVSAVPLGAGGTSYGSIEVEDQPRGPDELPIFAAQPQADVGYFQAMKIDLLEGRGFERGDGGDGVRAVVVSRSFANSWWPDASAVGRRVRFGSPTEAWYQIVGVVEDVRQEGLDQPIVETVYFPTVTEDDGQYSPSRVLDVVIRTAGDPLGFIPVLRREVAALQPRIPISNPRTMQDVFAGATTRTSFTMTVLGASSGIALLLGLVGIYGVISYVVSQRTREIGVRMALGATASTVRGMVLRQGLILAAIGVVLGLIAAMLISRVMASLLFGVSAFDPPTYAVVAGTLILVSALASWLPALRASSVDPNRALRAD